MFADFRLFRGRRLERSILCDIVILIRQNCRNNNFRRVPLICISLFLVRLPPCKMSLLLLMLILRLLMWCNGLTSYTNHEEITITWKDVLILSLNMVILMSRRKLVIFYGELLLRQLFPYLFLLLLLLLLDIHLHFLITIHRFGI